VAKDTNAFALRYGNIGRVVGPFSGNLDNAGERVLLTSEGQPVQDFTYSDGNHPPGSDPWPTAADGDGSSLVLMNPELAPYHNDVNNWRASIRIPGSPGRADLINFVEWSRRFPGIGAPSDDSDGDGASEQAEYFFGTSPTDSADKPGPISGELETLSVGGQDDVYLVFTFTRPLENEDVDYIVEFSMDLLTWPLVGVYLGLLDNGNGTVTERWRGAQPITDTESLFVRLRAQFR
jgi:hypothetical protein